MAWWVKNPSKDIWKHLRWEFIYAGLVKRGRLPRKMHLQMERWKGDCRLCQCFPREVGYFWTLLASRYGWSEVFLLVLFWIAALLKCTWILNVGSSCDFSTFSSVLKLFNAAEMALAQIWIETLDWNLCRIPSLETTTQVLDLSFNNFGKIRESVFREGNLFNLQKIFLHHCGISMVVGRCFEGITNLVEVDLSRNLLNNVPKEALRDCGYLMVLNLRGNPIRQVPGDSFQELQELQTLDLAECQITSIQPEALTPLSKLKWLKLDNNLLTSLQPRYDFPKGKQTTRKHQSDKTEQFAKNKKIFWPPCGWSLEISGKLSWHIYDWWENNSFQLTLAFMLLSLQDYAWSRCTKTSGDVTAIFETFKVPSILPM